jgi:hypothetical protein
MKLPHFLTAGANDNGPEHREPPAAWQAWVETLALVVALIGLGALIDPRDPFLLRRGFSWLTLAPLLAGLQYGSTRGLAAGAVQALALAIADKSGITAVPDPVAEIVLGWLIAGLLAGEFHDAWVRRAVQLESLGDHLGSRLESLGRSYLALKISHDRLQRAAHSRQDTFRHALAALQRELEERTEGVSLESIADRILALFSEHAFVRAATLHPVDRKGRPGPAVARLGGAGEADQDPLVRKAARTGITVSIRDAGDDATVLAAIPLVDVSCRTHAVVAVRDMPFLALQADTLELLAVLGGRLGETLSRTRPRPGRAAEAGASGLSREPATDVGPLHEPELAPVPARVEEAA